MRSRIRSRSGIAYRKETKDNDHIGLDPFCLYLSFAGRGTLFFGAAVMGVWRFVFIINRMHAAGIGDTLALFLILAGLAIGSGWNLETAKLLLLCVFLWFSSPVSSHFLSQIEYFTNPELYDCVEREESEEDRKAERAE